MFRGRCEYLEGAWMKRHVERRPQEHDFAVDGHLQDSAPRLYTDRAGTEGIGGIDLVQPAPQSRAYRHGGLPSAAELQRQNGQLSVAQTPRGGDVEVL